MGIGIVQGVPQIQDVPQNRSTSPIQPNQTGFGRNKNRKTFNSVLAVDTATQVCGMVTNMSMNVYWYLRKSMNETHCTRIGTLWKQYFKVLVLVP